MLLVLLRTQTSLPHRKFAHKGRRHGQNGWDVFTSHFSHSHGPLRFITSHSRVSRVPRLSLCRKRLKRLRKGSSLDVWSLKPHFNLYDLSCVLETYRTFSLYPNNKEAEINEAVRYSTKTTYSIQWRPTTCATFVWFFYTRVKNYVTAESTFNGRAARRSEGVLRTAKPTNYTSRALFPPATQAKSCTVKEIVKKYHSLCNLIRLH